MRRSPHGQPPTVGATGAEPGGAPDRPAARWHNRRVGRDIGVHNRGRAVQRAGLAGGRILFVRPGPRHRRAADGAGPHHRRAAAPRLPHQPAVQRLALPARPDVLHVPLPVGRGLQPHGAAALGGSAALLAALVQADPAARVLPGAGLLREVPDGQVRPPAVRHRRAVAVVPGRRRAAERGPHAAGAAGPHLG